MTEETRLIDVSGAIDGVIDVTLVEFSDGERGIAVLLPNGASLVMRVFESTALVQALANHTRIANEFNRARAQGAVGRMQ